MRVLQANVFAALAIVAAGWAINPNTNSLMRKLRSAIVQGHLKGLARVCEHYMSGEERVQESREMLVRLGDMRKKATIRSALYDSFGSRIVCTLPTWTEDDEIASAGPDRIFGTEDDLVVPVPRPGESHETSSDYR